MDWVQERIGLGLLAAVGHRVVHGGPKYWEPQRITPAMVEELHHLSPFDPEHLPEEILLTEAFHRRFPDLIQGFACFDTAFHHDLPRVAQFVADPKALQCERAFDVTDSMGCPAPILMEELGLASDPKSRERPCDPGASRAAARASPLCATEKPSDTSMSFTPAAGLPMWHAVQAIWIPVFSWYLSRGRSRVSGSNFTYIHQPRVRLAGVVSETRF